MTLQVTNVAQEAFARAKLKGEILSWVFMLKKTTQLLKDPLAIYKACTDSDSKFYTHLVPDQYTSDFCSWIKQLQEQHKLKYIHRIARVFYRRAALAGSFLELKVVTPISLTEELATALSSRLQQRYQVAHLSIIYEVCPQIITGLIIINDGLTEDFSAKAYLYKKIVS